MSEICAGIVTFQPEICRLKRNLISVVDQVDKVFVVDNNSTNLDEIRELINSFSNVVLIENDRNNGIAKALNQMCEAGDRLGYKWILSLDQDTIIPPDMLSEFQKYTSDLSNGIICPAIYYDGWNETIQPKELTEYVYACMTSASLTRIQAWKTVGGFREDYFIDFVDNEFCMRLGLNHYKILRVNACQVNHQLGDSGVKVLLWFRIKYSRHSSLRLYYMARNNYSFIQEYADYLPIMKEKVKLICVMIQGILFSKKKGEALRFVKRGLSDGKKGVLGEYINDEGVKG